MGLLTRLMPAKDRVQAGFDKLGPWVTQFRINGKTYGGNQPFYGDPRVLQMFKSFSNVKTILELGSLEGGQSFELARQRGVEKVVGVEGRQYNIDKANFVKKVLEVKNVEFVLGNLEDGLSQYGQFDAVFCCGLLYHLPRPWVLLDAFRAAAPRLVLSTHYSLESGVKEVNEGFPGHWYGEYGHGDPLSGLSPQSYWITLASMTARLKQAGFENVEVISEEPHPHGPILLLTAWSGKP